MFTVDSNQNLHYPHLAQLLRTHGEVTIRRLSSADISSDGVREGQQITIGFEIKACPSDLIQSARDNRLVSQLPKLLSTYHRSYLVLVGSPLEVDPINLRVRDGWRTTKFPYHYINSLLTKYEASGGKVRSVADVEHLVHMIVSITRYWNKKSHSSTFQLPKSHVLLPWEIKKINPLVQAYTGTGIGVKRATILARLYPSFSELVRATRKELLNIEGFGDISVDKLREFIHGTDHLKKAS